MEHCEACGTPEQLAQLKALIAESKDTPGCLMHILQEAQGIYGFLPRDSESPFPKFTASLLSTRNSRSHPKANTVSAFVSERLAT